MWEVGNKYYLLLPHVCLVANHAIVKNLEESFLQWCGGSHLCPLLLMNIIDGRYDWTARKSLFTGYFLWSTVGYGLGTFQLPWLNVVTCLILALAFK